MILLALFAVITLNINVISGAANIKVTSIEKCDTESDSIPWSFEMTNVDDNAYKKVKNAEFDFTDVQFTDELSYTLDVDKLNGGDWEKDVYNDEGNLCDLIKQYVPKAWQKLMATLEPRPVDMCNAQKGIFRLENFEVLKQDIQLPGINGKLRATLKLFDINDKDIFCATMEAEVTD